MKRSQAQEEAWSRIEDELAGSLRLRIRHGLLFWAPAWSRLQRSWESPVSAAVSQTVCLLAVAGSVVLAYQFSQDLISCTRGFLRGLAEFSIYS